MFVSPQGKEFETRLKEKKPGDLSDELRIALGMPVGPVRPTNVIIPSDLFNKTTTKVLKIHKHEHILSSVKVPVLIYCAAHFVVGSCYRTD